MASINVKNNSNTRLLFSIFKKGDAGIPFSTQWIDANQQHSMEIGNFAEVGVGVQIGLASAWVSSPTQAPTYEPNQTCIFTMKKSLGQ